MTVIMRNAQHGLTLSSPAWFLLIPLPLNLGKMLHKCTEGKGVGWGPFSDVVAEVNEEHNLNQQKDGGTDGLWEAVNERGLRLYSARNCWAHLEI
jgi:hypothetical protein